MYYVRQASFSYIQQNEKPTKHRNYSKREKVQISTQMLFNCDILQLYVVSEFSEINNLLYRLIVVEFRRIMVHCKEKHIVPNSQTWNINWLLKLIKIIASLSLSFVYSLEPQNKYSAAYFTHTYINTRIQWWVFFFYLKVAKPPRQGSN